MRQTADAAMKIIYGLIGIPPLSPKPSLKIDSGLASVDAYLDGGALLNDVLSWFATYGRQTSLGRFEPEPNGKNYNRYGTQIPRMAKYINSKFNTTVDGNTIKAMMYVETKAGTTPDWKAQMEVLMLCKY